MIKETGKLPFFKQERNGTLTSPWTLAASSPTGSARSSRREISLVKEFTEKKTLKGMWKYETKQT